MNRLGQTAIIVAGMTLSFFAAPVTHGQDRYDCGDPLLKLDVVHSDPKAFYISMDMDPRGNLYVGGRDAVYVFEADGEGGFKARRDDHAITERHLGVFVTGCR